jgi:nucleoside-diphosphate-sugar epimerase
MRSSLPRKSQAAGEWPDKIESIAELEEVLTRPSPRLIEVIRTVQSPLLLLGGSGKMGPTLAVLARRAALAADHPLEVIVASRFSDKASMDFLQRQEIRAIPCDFLEQEGIRELPAASNVIYMVGLKFGTAEDPSLTWAVNTLAPANVAEHFASSRIVALSTGNVYPLASVAGGGSQEGDPLTPAGEYPNAAVARERIFEFFSRRRGTPMALLRLNYAVELRYGVLLDIAQKVWSGQRIDVATGFFNCLWQADANEYVLRSLELAATPPSVYNLTGPQVLSVREIAAWFGRRMGKEVEFAGREAETALLSKPARLFARLGEPSVPFEKVLGWTADWVVQGGKTLGKPTHFEVRDGNF